MRSGSASILGQCITDQNFKFLDADKWFIDLVGREMRELRTLDILAVTHKEDRKPNSMHLDILRQRNEPFVIVKRYVRPDNSICWVRNHVSRTRDGVAGDLLLATVEAVEAPPQGDRALIDVAGRILKRRDVRCGEFCDDIFREPASDILVDLFIREQARREACVSSTCAASRAPWTTALRYITRLEDKGLLVRTPDPLDKRRFLLALTGTGRDKVVEMLKATKHAEAH